MNKTNRKNKTNLTVKWPTGFYTVDSLFNSNPEFIKITLRVRLNNAIKDGTVSVLGSIKGSKGRPKLAFANAPVSAETLKLAREAGVVEDVPSQHIIDVVKVSANTETVKETVVDESHDEVVTTEHQTVNS
jgi:hypothetical protein